MPAAIAGGRSSGSSGAASLMRAPAFTSSAATVSRPALASGSVVASRAPPPPEKRNDPGSPRLWAMRSGNAAASRRPGSPPGGISAAMRRRRRYCDAPRRMRDSAPRSTSPAARSRSASSLRPISAGASGARSGSRSSSSAARSAASATSRGVSAASIIADNLGCAPSRAIRRPNSVIRSAVSSAPRSRSRATPAASVPDGGGSRNASCAGGVPQAAQSRAKPDSSASNISGRSKGGRPRCSAVLQRRMAMPGASRPARPARCSAAAREMRMVARCIRPVDGSRRGARRQPPSTTMRTPGTVSEVSAIEVASTTRRPSAGRNARS